MEEKSLFGRKKILDDRINEITIILENKNRGGLDKFLLDFTKNISNKFNKINILCNVNHPGKIYIKKNIPKKINLIFYKVNERGNK